MPNRIIIHEPWSYVLFEDGGEYILTFMVGGVMERDFSVKLSEAEVMLQRQDQSFAERLVKRLASSPSQLQARQLESTIWPEHGAAP